ncbi:DUF4422 domain-containing protein [Megamonas funiformis]|mgnify:FL=1|uniref:DUF4422 domain-containing protein n=1 Tax=Megamonas funiformis TaxID=437897 RepID=UPI0022E0CEF6|nr:DUF4422 domain-containing protein [Megamonas funiformis]
MDIKVLIATHKKYWMPSDEVYMPIHVGKEGKDNLGYVGDNTGENISIKNPNYCELTGLYWAWKNLDCEYIGLCHYRRYFAHKSKNNKLESKKQAIFTKNDYEKLLQQYDVILPKKRNYFIETVRSQYEHAHNKKDLDEVERIIKIQYPSYMEAFEKVMNSRKLHIYNMFVMNKALFDEYCTWLFDILFTLEKRIDITNYDKYNARVFGFLSERLFNIWLEKKQLKIKTVDIIFLEKINWVKKGKDFLKRKFL